MKNILYRASLIGMLAASVFAQESLPTASREKTPRYEVTDLGTFGGSFSIAYGVDGRGRTAGAASLPGGNLHAFVTGVETGEHESNGRNVTDKTDLGTLGGLNSAAN